MLTITLAGHRAAAIQLMRKRDKYILHEIRISIEIYEQNGPGASSRSASA